jgi:hypothetical protein
MIRVLGALGNLGRVVLAFAALLAKRGGSPANTRDGNFCSQTIPKASGVKGLYNLDQLPRYRGMGFRKAL